MTLKTHSFNAETVGNACGTEEFALALGDAASRTYVDLGTEGIGTTRDVAVAFGQNSAGAETSLSTSVNETSPTSAGLALTQAGRLLFKRTNAAAFEFTAPRNSTGKMSSVLVNVGRTIIARAGGAGTTPTTDVNIGTASAAALLGVWYGWCLAVQAGTTTSNGKVYLKVWRESDSSILYEQESTTSNTGTTNVVSTNIGKPVANTGTILLDGYVTENAYDKTLAAIGPNVIASPTGIASAEAFGAVVLALTLAISPTGIGTAEAFGTPTVSTTITASPTGIASGAALGTPVISTSLVATPAGIASAESFGIPGITNSLTASPTGIGSSEAFGSPTLSTAAGSTTVNPTGIPSAEALGVPTVTTLLTVTLDGIPTSETFGLVVVATSIASSPTGIPSAEAFGTPVITNTGIELPTPIVRTLTAIPGSARELAPVPAACTLTPVGAALTLTLVEA